MRLSRQVKFQIGKKGLTPEVITQLAEILKKYSSVRVSVLKSATRNRDELKQLAETLKTKLKLKHPAKVIGYTIILKR